MHKLLQILRCVYPCAVASFDRVFKRGQVGAQNEMHIRHGEKMFDDLQQGQGVIGAAAVQLPKVLNGIIGNA